MKITFVADFLFVTLVTGMVLAEGKPDSVGGALVWLVIGGTILVIHALFTFDVFRRYVDRMAQRELDRDDRYEKPKRHAMQISNDGELVELGEDEPASSRLGADRKSTRS